MDIFFNIINIKCIFCIFFAQTPTCITFIPFCVAFHTNSTKQSTKILHNLLVRQFGQLPTAEIKNFIHTIRSSQLSKMWNISLPPYKSYIFKAPWTKLWTFQESIVFVLLLHTFSAKILQCPRFTIIHWFERFCKILAFKKLLLRSLKVHLFLTMSL